MYKLTNDNVEVAPDNLPNWSGYARYLESFPITERQALGWYSNIVESEIATAYADAETDTIYIPRKVLVDSTSERVLSFREQYRIATQGLCQLAGHVLVPKLEDTDYANVVQAAMATSQTQATLLTQTIMYCLFQLYRLDGDDAWDRI